MSLVTDYQKILKKYAGYSGEIDGDFGPLTLAAAQEYHLKNTPVPPWMMHAAQEFGVSEILGPRSNPRIEMYHASTSLGSAEDAVPWCSSFVNWCMERALVPGTNSAAARSWDKWGLATPIRYGAVSTVPRTGGSGRHVFFIAGFTTTHAFGLGGNQADAVNVAVYRRPSLTATRWPKGWA